MASDPENAIRRHPGGKLPLKQTLRDITASVPHAKLPLDLVHVTSTGWAERVLAAGQLETRQCGVFKKELLYFFVAQAAYRSFDSDEKTDKLTQFPAVFVVGPERIGAPHHVYPFDTGAAASGRFPGAKMDGVHLEDYALENNLDAARRLIVWAFGTQADYVERNLRPNLDDEVDPWQFSTTGYLRIARLASETRNDVPDARAAAIEVAYARNIRLKGNARLLILPHVMLENPKTQRKNSVLLGRAEQLGIEVVPYEWKENDAPDWHMAAIEGLVRTKLRCGP